MGASLTQKPKVMNDRHGFTIVELLIVVVVIAILAAITIVAYNGIQNRAKVASAQQASSQGNKKILSFAIDNAESYPVAAGSSGIDNLVSLGIINSGNTSYQYSSNNASTPKTFCLTATYSNVSYYISQDSSTPTAGACAGHGINGVAPITNLARNPEAISGGATNEWSSRYSQTPSWVTGASDGPMPAMTTYFRETQGGATTGAGRGVDHKGNLDLSTPSGGADNLWPVTSGSPVVASSYVRSSISNTNALISYRIHDGAGTWLTSSVSCSPVTYTANTWLRLTCLITPPFSGYLALSTRLNQSLTWTAGATIDATGLMVTTGSTTYTYASGNSVSWAWNGTAGNASSSGPPL